MKFKDKQIFLDGKSTLIMSGEFHYFRSEVEEWDQRIKMVKNAGCNAIATYIPWCIHELEEGKLDLDGHTNPRLNIKKFLELCEANDMYVIVRPGPFTMAELIGDGIPTWVPKKHPETVPITWDNRKATTITLDYLSPNFLKESRKWYKSINEVIEPHVYPKGKVISYQLDNEVGMLSWVSNCPDLTEVVIKDFIAFLEDEYTTEQLLGRYPISTNNFDEFVQMVRKSDEKHTLQLHKDLGHYMRLRYKKYFETLKEWAKEDGIREIPFLINIHGCGGGRALPFPIGISQLYKSYEGIEDIISGTDIYLDKLNIGGLTDWYIVNVLTDATNGNDQPLTSLEFSAGSGDYGNNLQQRSETSRADFATRMFIAQNNKMLNYYTFFGGTNYRVDKDLQNGTDRIAMTGHQHGFAAPIKVDGSLCYTYDRTEQVIKLMSNMSDKIATSFEDTDDLAYGFIPDYFMTEFRADNPSSHELVRALEHMRSFYSWDTAVKALLVNGVSFRGINIQDKEITSKALFLPSSRYMDASIQQKVAEYIENGGKVLLYGEVPQYDMEGTDCTILADFLDLEHKEFKHIHQHGVDLSIQSTGWAEGYYELHRKVAQTLECSDQTEVLFTIYGSEDKCGFDIKIGDGRCIAITCEYNTNLDLYKKIVEKLNIKQKLKHTDKDNGLFMTSTINDMNERFIHVLNLDDKDKQFNIILKDEVIFENFKLNRKEGVMLPIEVKFDNYTIQKANAEVYDYKENTVTFRLVGHDFSADIAGENLTITSDNDIQVEKTTTGYKVYKTSRNYGEDFVTLNIK